MDFVSHIPPSIFPPLTDFSPWSLYSFFPPILIALTLLYYSHFGREILDQPKSLPGFALNSVFPFFRQRYDFLNWGYRITDHSCYQFRLINDTVIVLSGEKARQAFLNAKNFDLTEGFKVLSGAIPMVRGVTSDLQTKRIALIHKRLASVQKTEQLTRLLPSLLDDSRIVMSKWGNAGNFDPFVNIYELSFQTTVRCLSCQEIAEDPALVAKLKTLYDTLDRGTTPATVLLPWLPTPAMLKKLWATKQIYDIIVQAIGDREQSGVHHDDTLQFLLDSGDDKLVVVGFIIGLLVAGARATGTTASWMMTYLSSPAHSVWRDKAQDEVQGLLSSHSTGGYFEEPVDLKSSDSLSRALKLIPLEAWENGTPILDLIIKETLRVAQPHTAMRKNLGPDVYIEGKQIPRGAYVIYPFSDVHLDEELYEDPWRWDPSRPTPQTVAYGSIVWGAGNTICLGQRLARLELKIIAAMFLLGFKKTALVDEQGNGLICAPRPNWNDILLARPSQTSYIQYERTQCGL